MANECQICAEQLNNSTRALIPCETSGCEFAACKTCVRTYLLGTSQDPHCMSCRKAWSQNYLVTKLNRSFVTKDFKDHRKKQLLEQQLSRLPTSMEAADRVRRSSILEGQAEAVRAEIIAERLKLNNLQAQYAHLLGEAHRIKTGKEAKKEKKEFIMPCPNQDCRGFLSAQWKCELCQMHSCSKCFEIIGQNKNEPHECKEDNVKSAELIRKECRQCPGKCGANIFKTQGCDQMFCTQCHVAFSWKTGEIERGAVHNPHWYQWQASLNNGTATRTPGDVLCGGLPNYYEIRNRILPKITEKDYIAWRSTASERDFERFAAAPAHMLALTSSAVKNTVSELHRVNQEINHMWLRDTRERVQNLGDGENIRIDYILGKISKEGLADAAYKNDNMRRKFAELLHVYELLSVVGIEIFATLCNSTRVGVPFIVEIHHHINSYHKLRLYCNKQLAQISISYNQRVPSISSDWKIEKIKAKLSCASLYS